MGGPFLEFFQSTMSSAGVLVGLDDPDIPENQTDQRFRHELMKTVTKQSI